MKSFILIVFIIATTLPQSIQANDIQWPCLFPPTMSRDIPGDTSQSDQAGLNCLAWQQFIALNWPAKKIAIKKDFGIPGDFSPVVFETYINVQEFLKPDGSKPPPWNQRAYALSIDQNRGKKNHVRPMYGTAKITLDFNPDDDLGEAFPRTSSKAWLADTNGNLVWYEILVNKSEFEYFYNNQFYNSIEQYKAAKSGQHIDLPKGDLSGKSGAMEFKAAWLTVNDPDNNKWLHYKMTKANICSADGACHLQDFALVGLHIIHKTTAQASWIWSTFEHVDNAPDLTQIKSGAARKNKNGSNPFTFYDSDCTPKDIPPECVNGHINMQTSCSKNTSPAYALSFVAGLPAGQCKAYPIQVVREFSIPNTLENPVITINKAAHQLIRDANSDSVYQYYNLINVLWNDSPIDENAGLKPPIKQLSDTGFRPNPNTFPVSNTVLETYIQSVTCIACHSSATINTPKNGTTFASDYSFLFGKAGHPQTTKSTLKEKIDDK